MGARGGEEMMAASAKLLFDVSECRLAVELRFDVYYARM